VAISRATRHRINKILWTLLTAIVTMLVISPFFWMLSTSFKKVQDQFLIPPQLVPQQPTLENYAILIDPEWYFPNYFLNSTIVACGTTGLALCVALMASYALSRFRLPGRRSLMLFILMAQMFPSILLLLSLYLVATRLHLLNNYLGLILADTVIVLPFSVWMLKSYFDSIPRDLDDMAMIDGCNPLQVLTKVLLPSLAPGLAAVGLFCFAVSWDEFVYALTFMNIPYMRTIPPGIVLSFIQELQISWGAMMAVSVVTSAPLVVLFIFLQRYLVAGLTAGAVKG
jgi:multiple sugar transport system permease protein